MTSCQGAGQGSDTKGAGRGGASAGLSLPRGAGQGSSTLGKSRAYGARGAGREVEGEEEKVPRPGVGKGERIPSR